VERIEPDKKFIATFLKWKKDPAPEIENMRKEFRCSEDTTKILQQWTTKPKVCNSESQFINEAIYFYHLFLVNVTVARLEEKWPYPT